jgi:hypothetical protein
LIGRAFVFSGALAFGAVLILTHDGAGCRAGSKVDQSVALIVGKAFVGGALRGVAVRIKGSCKRAVVGQAMVRGGVRVVLLCRRAHFLALSIARVVVAEGVFHRRGAGLITGGESVQTVVTVGEALAGGVGEAGDIAVEIGFDRFIETAIVMTQ